MTAASLRWRRHAPWLAALLIGSALAVLYGRYLAAPSEYFVGDLVNYYQPMRSYEAGCLASGRLPLWTPAIFAGTPMIADAQLGIFYPPTWLHLAVPFPLAELVLFLGHLLLGGLGMCFLARRLHLGWAPALLGGLGFALGGFFVSHAVHPNFVHSAAWVPWLAAFLHGVVVGGGSREAVGGSARRRAVAEAAGAALVTGLCLLAGGVQIAYFGVGLSAVLALGWLVSEPEVDHRARLLRGGAVLGALGLGVGLAAVQLLPTAELASLSIRAEGVTLELARTYRLAARQGLGLVVPFPFGLAERTPVVWSQPFHESFGYFGVVTLPLALTALFGIGWRRRSPEAADGGSQGQGLAPWREAVCRLLLALLALGALLVAMGPEAPVDLHRRLFAWLPGFDRFRAPGRLLFVVMTACLVLAAMGLADLLGEDAERRARARRLHLGFSLLVAGVALAVLLLASGAAGPMPEATAALSTRSALGAVVVVMAVVLLVAGGARWRVPAAWVGAGVVAVHLLDLVTVGRAVVAARRVPDGVDIARLGHRPPAEIGADPRRAHHDYRVLYRPDSYFMLQNAGLLFGYDNLRTYSPVMLRRTYDLVHLADRGRFPRWARLPVDHNNLVVRGSSSPVLKLLGVRHVVGHDRPRGAPGRRVDLRWQLRTLPGALPRAFLVHRTRLATRREEREQWLPRIDPAREALVESPGAMVDPEGEPADAPAPGAAEQALVTHRDRCRGDARIRVEAERPGLLVFTEAWHPGWRATVGGRPAPVHRVDHGLLGVRIPRAGSTEVRLRFRPASLTRGAWLTGLSAGILLALLLVPWSLTAWRRRGRGRGRERGRGRSKTRGGDSAGNPGASRAS